MDNSRDADLKALHERFNNPLVPLHKRQKAYKVFQSIQTQVNDRKLVELRHRLIRAAINDDPDAVGRIELLIRDYKIKVGYAEV